MLKDRLGIPASDTSRDAALTSLLAAVNAYVLRTTHYALEDGTVASELHDNYREYTDLYTALRPLDPATAVTARGRVLGSTDWTDLVVEVIDAAKGRVKIIGNSSVLRPWPPTAWTTGLVRRWRQNKWPLIELGYDYTAPSAAILAELASAAADLAAFSDQSVGTAGVTSLTVGQVTEQYALGTMSLPPLIGSTLSAFLPTRARLA
jgi:hypothetical protein